MGLINLKITNIIIQSNNCIYFGAFSKICYFLNVGSWPSHLEDETLIQLFVVLAM